MAITGAFLFTGIAIASENKRGVLDDLDNYRPYRAPNFNSNYRIQTLPKDKQMADKCQEFIKDDGTYGELGEMVKKEITGQGKSEALAENFFDTEPENIKDICRNFKSFGPDEKLNFWIYVMAAVAQNESGCDPAAKNDKAGPKFTGVAVGLFQTPALEEGKLPTWRGKGCTTPPEFESAESQVACGMEIMSDLLDGKLCAVNKGQYTPFDDKSYWATLRPTNTEQGADKISKKLDTLSIIKEFPLCNN